MADCYNLSLFLFLFFCFILYCFYLLSGDKILRSFESNGIFATIRKIPNFHSNTQWNCNYVCPVTMLFVIMILTVNILWFLTILRYFYGSLKILRKRIENDALMCTNPCFMCHWFCPLSILKYFFFFKHFRHLQLFCFL